MIFKLLKMRKGEVPNQKAVQKANTAYTIQIRTKPIAQKMDTMRTFKNKNKTKKVLTKGVN